MLHRCTSRIFHFRVLSVSTYYQPLISHSFSVISENITINHTVLKTRFFGLHFCRREFRSSHCDVTAPKAIEFSEITQHNSHYAVQCDSRSPLSVVCTNRKPIFYFLFVNNSNLHPILHRFRDMADYGSFR